MNSDPWLTTSIMAKRGLAKGQAGQRHQLSIAAQGDFHYVYGPYARPILTIDPGDVVVVETEDAFGGVITSEQDSPTAKLKFPFLNPQCGPIAVNGAEKGDCLAVHIHAVETRGAQPAGTTCIIPEFGGLVGTASTAMLNAPLPERVRKMHVDKDGVRWSDKIVLPYEPFIGTIGVSPEIEAISSLQPDYHGGNMDLPDVAPGAILYFPVHSKGGLLYVGDCHATQGDGELSGVAIEQRATVTLQIDLIKNWSFAWPRLETEKFHHDDRQRPAAGGCGAHRLSRTGALDERGLRIRRDRRLHAAQSGRPDPARQHGRSEIYHGCVDLEESIWPESASATTGGVRQ